MRLRRRTDGGHRGDVSDRRPTLAVGHVGLSGQDLRRLAQFYEAVGMRRVVRLRGVAILEMRGGTHLAIATGAAGAGTLDLMVDDIDDAHRRFDEVGARPSPIRRSGTHRTFVASDPEGNELRVNSSHVVGPV